MPLKNRIDKTMILMTNGSLMEVESIAEGSPAFLKTKFGLFENGRFTPVLL